MTPDRVDSASRLVPASPSAVYQAFAQKGAMEEWLAPNGMTARMLDFDFREGGSYRMRLTYKEPRQGGGKTADDHDEVRVRLVRLIDGKRIEQAVTFESDDPSFSGVMRMTWAFEAKGNATLVTIRCEDVPIGIRPEDHEVGLSSALENLSSFLEQRGS